ncbi:energy transducer TonB [Sphingomonas sp. LM7]|uniref:energy transducer TonB n=1 Tax=Sphingomonas sp. LM7 TaxID=1938607 RepID=UPI0009839002|nr:energy transducer TonB [Sphingomonas sp. LM7]AQR72357.1 hypothetical protein BXU08_00560 [Sphingomonas sp. LM7]
MNKYSRMLALMLLSLSTLVHSVPASAQREVETLTRTGKWVLNIDRDSCQLIGQFGEGDHMVTAKFTRFQPDDSFDLALVGKRMHSYNTNAHGKIDFGLKGAPVEFGAMNGKIGDRHAAFISNLRFDGWRADKPGDPPPRIPTEQEAKVAGVTIALAGKPAFRLQFGSATRQFAQLRDCAIDLMESWGYDRQVQLNLRRAPKPATPPGNWLLNGDYPRSAIAMGRGGFVQFRLDVDAEGKVKGCYILARTDPDEFSEVLCRALTKRGMFEPALDEKGTPVRWYFVSKARFETPG